MLEDITEISRDTTASYKSPDALRTIGEVAEELGIATHVLRFWEARFKQIEPQKRRGRRYYRPQDIKIILEIKSLLYSQGFTIKGVQKYLDKNVKEILKKDEDEIVRSAGNYTESSKFQTILQEDIKKSIKDISISRMEPNAQNLHSQLSSLQNNLILFRNKIIKTL